MKNIQISDLIVPDQLNKSGTGDGTLQLSPIQVKEDYRKEWNIDSNDFVVLTKNGELISNSLYRVGGLGGDINGDYFMLLKHVEAVDDFKFIKKCYPCLNNKQVELRRKYLASCWCILDKNGTEKKVFKQFENPYIKRGSCIYSLGSNYYNIETDEFYCYASSSMESSEFLFLDATFENDPQKKGIMKINKKDGSWTVFQ